MENESRIANSCTVTIVKGEGVATVTPEPGTYYYQKGETIEVTATYLEGYNPGTGTGSYTVNGNMTINVVASLPKYTVQFNLGTGVKSATITSGTKTETINASTSKEYPKGTNITVTATAADANSTITSGTGNYTINEPKTIEIKARSKLYLYNNGNQCEDATGGWELWSYHVEQDNDLTTNNYMYAHTKGTTGHFGHVYIRTKNKIDISDYEHYEVKVRTNCKGDFTNCFGFSNNLKPGNYYRTELSGGSFISNKTDYPTTTTITGDIPSNLPEDSYYFVFGGLADNGNEANYYVESVMLY